MTRRLILTCLWATCAVALSLPAPRASAGDYVADRHYAAGNTYTIDRFATDDFRSNHGRKLARLANGDVVMAGAVHAITQDGSGGMGLGLLRRTPDGQLVPWADRNAGTPFSTDYNILDPITVGGTRVYVSEVKDLTIQNELLLVLADTWTTTGFWQSSIYVFGLDGSFKGANVVDNHFSSAGPREVWGSGLASWRQSALTDSRVYYIGRKKVGAVERITFRRFTLTSAGALTAQTGLLTPNIGSCSMTTWHCSGQGIALGSPATLGGSPRIYITGSIDYPPQPEPTPPGWYAYIAQISATDGSASSANFQMLAHGTRGRGIAVRPRGGFGGVDDVFVVAEQDLACKSGAFVFARQTSGNWSKVIGGSNAATCLPTLSKAFIPTALALQGDRVAVAGRSVWTPTSACLPGDPCPSPEDHVDGAVAVLVASTGELVSPGAPSSSPQPVQYPYTRFYGGPRERHSAFFDIVGDRADSFIAGGTIRTPEDFPTDIGRGTVQFGTLRIQDAAPSNLDELFKDGFESRDGVIPATPVPALAQQQSVVVGGMLSDRFTWRDSALRPRSATLAHNDGQTGPQGQYSPYQNRGGALRQFTYQLPNGSTRTVGTTQSGNAGEGGFGYVVSHAKSTAFCAGPDDSPLGYSIPGAFTRVFTGRHHAIFRFTQNYPRNCVTGTPTIATTVPVTIEWMFATGLDHPIWSVTYDLSSIDPNRLEDDSRAPYGELLFDGAAGEGTHAQIAGVAWGDRYAFTTTSAPLTLNSDWTWTTYNDVPYVKLWTTSSNATMGIVQTQTIYAQDAGGYYGVNLWGDSSASVPQGCTAYTSTPTRMPCPWNWPYQANAYSLDTTPTRSTRLAWGTNYGFLGSTSYLIHGSEMYGGPIPNVVWAPGHPRKSYSTYIVLGQHSDGPVEAQVKDIERLQGVALTASVGTVASSGPSGVGDATAMTYSPRGVDPIRNALTFSANASNQLDANIAAQRGALKNPLIVVRNFTDSTPEVRLGNTLLTADIDYFASHDAATSQLWITLNRTLEGSSNRLRVAP